MALTFKYNADLCIAEIICGGPASFDDLKDGQVLSFALAKEHNTDRFLLDLTNYKSSLLSYEILDGISTYDDKTTRRIRIAVVAPVSEEPREDARFYETVCVNRGWNARMFAKRQEAADWLMNREKE